MLDLSYFRTDQCYLKELNDIFAICFRAISEVKRFQS